ncbi:MAG: PaaI family thioesterase [Gammaproteobacteria bacterium]|nr:PaaI family thioesterase [Gammaproteobacteria bacterium]
MSDDFQPSDPGYRERVIASFNRQGVMETANVSIVTIAPGLVELAFPHHSRLTQQHGFIHAGIVTTVLDSACGYAAFSLMPEDAAVLSVEFKINLLAPSNGERFHAIGRVRKPGRTITVVEGDFYSIMNGERKLSATMVGTMMAIYGRKGIDG